MKFPGTLRAQATRLAGVLLAATLVTSCRAQQDPAPTDDPPPNPGYTLEVFADLIQLPVLILGPHLDVAPKVDGSKLLVSIDYRTPFTPTHVRPQGDDPIALALFIDSGDPQNIIVSSFASSLPRITSTLKPQDRVAVYVLDCALVRAVDFTVPDAESGNHLKSATREAINTLKARRKAQKGCPAPVHTLEALTAITAELQKQPGRRVIFASVTGTDVAGAVSSLDMQRNADTRSVTIFGVTGIDSVSFSSLDTGGGPTNNNSPMSRRNATPSFTPNPRTLRPGGSAFGALCESTGGISHQVTDEALDDVMRRFVRNLRERYIVEFPRPKDIAGSHLISVSLPKSEVFIRTGSISFTYTEVKGDPNAIHRKASPEEADEEDPDKAP